ARLYQVIGASMPGGSGVWAGATRQPCARFARSARWRDVHAPDLPRYTPETPGEQKPVCYGQRRARSSMRRLRRRRLSTQVVIMQIAILVVTSAAGLAVVQWHLRREIDSQYENRALAVAESLASQTSVIRGVEAGHPGPGGVVQ